MAAAQVLPADQPGGTTTLAHAGIGGDPLEVACERVVVTVDGQQLPSASGRASPTRSPLSPGGGVPPLDGCEAAAADGELTPKATDAPTAAAVLPPPRWSLRLLRPSLRSWAEAASLLAWAFTGVAFVVRTWDHCCAAPLPSNIRGSGAQSA